MISLDLRWVLFGVLAAITTAVLLAVWLDRRQRRRHGTTIAATGDLQHVLENAPVGWVVLEGPASFCYANAYARRLLGLSVSAGSIPDASWARLLEEDRLAARHETGAGRYRNVTLPANQVARWYVTSGNALDVVLLQDITAQTRAEQAAGYLFSALSHELRTPLGTLLTHLEVLLLPDISEQMRGQSLGLMKAEAKRMSRLVNQMLELGRLETSVEIERCPVDLLPLVEQAIAQVSSQAEERGVALSLEAETPLPPVAGKSDYLLQVFLNLLDNAVKYSRRGDRAIVSLWRCDDGIACTVHDTGPGIPGEHLPYVTRRFYRAVPQEVEGSGLGLALVDEILRRHGSRLEIESRVDGTETGTRARFILPVLSGGEA